jgi:hypothetical protein
MIFPPAIRISFFFISCVSFWNFLMLKLWRSVVECRTYRPGSKDPGFESCSYPITCSPEQLDWSIKDRVVCGLPVIRAPKRPLGIIRKESRNLPGPKLPNLAEVGIIGPQRRPTAVRVGESPRSRASKSGQSQNHWASMVPNHSESRGISPVTCFQFC